MSAVATPHATQALPVEAEAGRLYDRYSSRIFAYCLAILRDREEAEDALQTTFLRAMQGLRREPVLENELAWLITIARNTCFTRINASKRKRTFETAQDPALLAETTVAPAPPEGASELTATVARLPERQREAILLREWQGLSYREIATRLGLTTAAVETLIFRARRSLAAQLSGEATVGGRLRSLGFGPLLGTLKSALGGSALKAAAAVATAVVAGAVLGAGAYEALSATPGHAVRAHTVVTPAGPRGALLAQRELAPSVGVVPAKPAPPGAKTVAPKPKPPAGGSGGSTHSRPTPPSSGTAATPVQLPELPELPSADLPTLPAVETQPLPDVDVPSLPDVGEVVPDSPLTGATGLLP